MDCTILFYTANLISDHFANKVRQHLLDSSGGIPIISISHKPIQFGENICVDLPVSVYSIYKQILIGAKKATTKYVVCCEDDALYVPEHFCKELPDNAFFYNVSRWSITPNLYFFRHRRLMSMCIASRQLMIDTLEARFQKYPDNSVVIPHLGEPGKRESRMGLPTVSIGSFSTEIPTITFNHNKNIGGRRRQSGAVEEELPYWGSAKDLWRKYINEN